MAIIKEVTLDNGISMSYHRIMVLTIVTNSEVVIEIKSYINQAQREEEKDIEDFYKNAHNHANVLDENNNPVFNGYTYTEFYSIPYDETMNIVSAYDYIKTLPKYEGSIDVI